MALHIPDVERNESAEKVLLALEKGGFRGIFELKSLLISL